MESDVASHCDVPESVELLFCVHGVRANSFVEGQPSRFSYIIDIELVRFPNMIHFGCYVNGAGCLNSYIIIIDNVPKLFI